VRVVYDGGGSCAGRGLSEDLMDPLVVIGNDSCPFGRQSMAARFLSRSRW